MLSKINGTTKNMMELQVNERRLTRMYKENEMEFG